MRVVPTPPEVAERLVTFPDDDGARTAEQATEDAILNALVDRDYLPHRELLAIAISSGIGRDHARGVIRRLQECGLIIFGIRGPTGYRLGHHSLEPSKAAE